MLYKASCLLLLGSASVFGVPDAQPEAGTQHEGRDYRGNTIRVHSGGSIQSALDKAPPGTRIIVEGGTYLEQITIQKDGITLIGEEGAMIEPPSDPTKNDCSDFAGDGTQAGICIVGKGLELTKFKTEHKKVLSVRRPVRGVTVTGFQVQKFTGFNILVLGAEDAKVHRNKLGDGSIYGFLTAGSRNTEVADNDFTSTVGGFIGLCMDNFSGVKITGNSIESYYIGLCVQTDGAVIADNRVSHTCFGAFLDPGVRDVRLSRNKFTNAIPQCGPFGATAILLDGSVGARIQDNYISGWKSDGPAGGIAIVDDPCNADPLSLACILRGGTKAVSSGNLVKGNVLIDNGLDILVQTEGRGNDVRKNKCTNSQPSELCGARRT